LKDELTISQCKQRHVPGEYSYILTSFFNPTNYIASNGEDDCEKRGRKHIAAHSTVLSALLGESKEGHTTCKDNWHLRQGLTNTK
jgi:hypothetical protein